jgi:hypothetical protein
VSAPAGTPRAARALGLPLAGAVLAGAILAGACKKQEEPAPAPVPARSIVGEAELKRGHDACTAYVAQVCACAQTVPAAEEPCKLAKALPEALEVALSVSAHPETERKEAVQSAAAIRKTIARCIEQTAQLPALGCAAPGPRR